MNEDPHNADSLNKESLDENQYAEKIRELLRVADAMLTRPDVVALLSGESSEQLMKIRSFAKAWNELALTLTREQQANYFTMLDSAVQALCKNVSDLERLQLSNLPPDKMGHA